MNFCHILPLLVVIAVELTLAASGSINDYDNCKADYNILEKAVFNDPDNVLKLTTTFFPPHVDSPLYITVKYNFSTSSVNYIWSTASLYLVVHPKVIRYLSLFFSYAENNRIVHLEFQLPQECADFANNTRSDTSNFLYIFTHRVSCMVFSIAR